MKNNKGYVPVQALLILAFISGFTGSALKETHDNGILKQNGKIIWCKMQNKGQQYCDSLY